MFAYVRTQASICRGVRLAAASSARSGPPLGPVRMFHAAPGRRRVTLMNCPSASRRSSQPTAPRARRAGRMCPASRNCRSPSVAMSRTPRVPRTCQFWRNRSARIGRVSTSAIRSTSCVCFRVHDPRTRPMRGAGHEGRHHLARWMAQLRSEGIEPCTVASVLVGTTRTESSEAPRTPKPPSNLKPPRSADRPCVAITLRRQRSAPAAGIAGWLCAIGCPASTLEEVEQVPVRPRGGRPAAYTGQIGASCRVILVRGWPRCLRWH